MVPITATRYSIDALKLPTVVDWYPWYEEGKVGVAEASTDRRRGKKRDYVKYVFRGFCR